MASFCRYVKTIVLYANSKIELRILVEEDAPIVFAVIDRNRLRLKEWLGWLDSTIKVEDSRKFIAEGVLGFEAKKVFRFGVFVAGEFAGIIELQAVDYQNRKSSIGYWLAEGFQGMGVMTQSLIAILKYAFNELHLNRLELHIATKNIASIKIATRVGFHKEGVLRQNEWLYDHFVDHNCYSILREELIP